MRNPRTIPLLTILALLLAVLPLAAAPQDKPHAHRHGAMTESAEKAPMGDACAAMMEHHAEMQERMKAMDAELDGLLAEVENATGDAKVDALAAVVEELVEQRRSMHAMMAKHQPMMMRHRMQHMGEGGAMSDCPMMQRMKGMQEIHGGDAEAPVADEHSAHHPD